MKTEKQLQDELLQRAKIKFERALQWHIDEARREREDLIKVWTRINKNETES